MLLISAMPQIAAKCGVFPRLAAFSSARFLCFDRDLDITALPLRTIDSPAQGVLACPGLSIYGELLEV